MDDATIDYAKQHLEELIERALNGEDVRISDPRLGTVQLAAAPGSSRTRRIPGQWKGRIDIPDDKLLEPLSADELAWLSGEQSR